MKREHFVKVVEEALDSLDSLPQEFRSRIRNVAVLIEDMPPNQPSPQSGSKGCCCWVSSMACPPPRRAYLTYRRRLTVIHELGHYFGMDENQLKDV